MRAAVLAGLIAGLSGCIELELFPGCEENCPAPRLDASLPQLSDPGATRALVRGGVATLRVAEYPASEMLRATGDEGMEVEAVSRNADGIEEVRVRLHAPEGTLHLSSEETTRDVKLRSFELASVAVVPVEDGFLRDDEAGPFVRLAGTPLRVVVRLAGGGERLIDEDTLVTGSWGRSVVEAWDRFALPAGGANGTLAVETRAGRQEMAVPEVDAIDDIVPRAAEGLASPDEVQSKWREVMLCFEARNAGRPVAGVVWTMTTIGTRKTAGCIELSSSSYATTLTVEAGGLVRKYTIRRQ